MRRTTTERGYGWDWQQVSTAMIGQHVAKHGWLCPGDPDYDHPMHQTKANGLTVDHVDPTDPNTALEVICNNLNTRRRSAA